MIRVFLLLSLIIGVFCSTAQTQEIKPTIHGTVKFPEITPRDLLVYSRDGTGTIYVLHYSGNGTWVIAQEINASNGLTRVEEIEAADLNGDGFADIAMEYGNGYEFGLLMSQGNGTYDKVVNMSQKDSSQGVEIADLNNDGFLDVAAGYLGSGIDDANGKIYYYLNKGDGSFFDPISSFGMGTVSDFTFIDVNDDGLLDLSVSTWFPFSVGRRTELVNYPSQGIDLRDGVPFWTPFLGFYDRFTAFLGWKSSQVLAGKWDINNDGYTDILFDIGSTYDEPESVFKVFYSDGKGNFPTESRIEIPKFSFSDSTIGDFDNDGQQEILFSIYGNKINKGCELRFETHNNRKTPQLPDGCFGLVSALDYNRDGNLDFISEYATIVTLWRGNGDLTFTFEKNISSLFPGVNHLGPFIPVFLSEKSPYHETFVTNGSKAVKVDDTGRFVMSNVPPGKQTLTPLKSGFKFETIDFTSEANTTYKTSFIGLRSTQNSGITPGVGISSAISSPTFTLWNGFLDMINILELVNVGEDELKATVTLFQIDGTQAHQQTITINPFGQFDLILNDLPGFQKDSYGIVTVEFTGQLDGRLFYYRNGTAGDYEFAFGVPYSAPLFGQSSVGFNTFQPSLAPGDSANPVLNWLSIVNLASEPKSFTIEKYNQIGELLSTETITIPAFGRVDTDGGHTNPGPGQVGLNKIIPTDNNSPYIAQLIRYGTKTSLSPSASYAFAFPLVAKTGQSGSVTAPISSRFGASNWVEIVNVTDSTVEVNAIFYDATGNAVSNQNLSLAANSQIHLEASSFLPAEQSGHAVLTPNIPSSISAQSMYYFRKLATGQMASMYGIQSRRDESANLFGSYNLFLGMDNWLRVTNPTSETVTINFLTGTNSDVHSADIPANGTIEIPLHQTEAYQTAVDSYGIVALVNSSAGNILSELIRVKTLPDGDVDFAAPTEVR